MSAVVMYGTGGNWPALSIAVVLAALVLAAHLGAYRAKRLVGAGMLALVLAGAAATVRPHTNVAFVNPCNHLTPGDPMWWVSGCFWPI